MKLVAIVLLLFLVSCSDSDEHNLLAKKIGDYLLNETRTGGLFLRKSDVHPNIIRIGKGFSDKLTSLKNKLKGNCSTIVNLGDSRVGDGSATHHVFLLCEQVKYIGVRLKYDKKKKSFHILGYWTSGI
tara:strand:+ start:71 stop:454 length:384 start_codon:yes stop_codon:yes gene_type:complete